MESVNGYVGGMDKDTSKVRFNNQRYFDANNIRLITDAGLSSGSIENIKGNQIQFTLQDISTKPRKIIGHCLLRNEIIIFTTNNTKGYIEKIVVDYNLPTTDSEILFEDNLGGNGSLGFSLDNPIRAVGNIETEITKKVYWSDYNNVLRHVNIVDLENGVALTVSDMDIISDTLLTMPFIADISNGGQFKSGMVQHTYQLYNVNGSESLFAPLSALIHITSNNDFDTSSGNYKGDKTQIDANKKVTTQIDSIDSNFDNIKVYSFYYATLTSAPEIRVIYDGPISDTSMTFDDDYFNTLDTLTLSEYLSLKNIFTCKDLKIKDNILFPVNIKETAFDPDWDARAYRFDSSSISHLYDSFDDVSPSITITSGFDWTTIPEDAELINKFNDFINTLGYTDNSLSTTFDIYQRDGITLGAEGPNVKISFTASSIIIRDGFITNYGLNQVGIDNSTHVVNDVSINNNSYTNFASPLLSGLKRGYQSNEVYRIGVVLYNNKGQKSFVKWVCDIRFPMSLYLSVYDGSTNGNTRGNINALHIELYNLPDDVVSVEIVRVERTIRDRTVVSAGILETLIKTDSNFRGTHLIADNSIYDSVSSFKHYEFTSPEVLFTNYQFYNDDYIQIAGIYKNIANNNIATTDPFNIRYFRTNVGSLNRTTFNPNMSNGNRSSLIKFAKKIKSNPTTAGSEAIDNVAYHAFDGDSYYNYIRSGLDRENRATTSIIKTVDNIQPDTRAAGEYVYAYHMRSINQYGGSSYSSRQNNTYMSTGAFINVSSNQATLDVYGGDIYICILDFIRSSWDKHLKQLDSITSIDTTEQTVNIPVETTINLTLRDDLTIGQANVLNNFPGTYITAEGMEEGSYSGIAYAYTINPVYLRENNVVGYTPKPLNFTAIDQFDVRILASNNKQNGELIDSFLKYNVASFIDIDAQYGPINAAEIFKNQLMVFQDNAVGIASVNERAVTQDQTGNAIILGTSGVLPRFDYISNISGCKHRWSIVKTESAIYWFDIIHKKLNRFTGGIENLSDTKSMSSFFSSEVSDLLNETDNPFYQDNITSYGGIVSVYDNKHKEVLFTFIQSEGYDSFTIAFNEMLNAFTSFYSFKPRLYILVNNSIFSSLNETASNSDIYIHDKGVYSEFYGTIFNSDITLLINNGTNKVKQYRTIEYLSEVFDTNGNILDETVNVVNVSNDTQSSGDITLVLGNNIRRFNRTWRLNMPRELTVDAYKPRMKDVYLKMMLRYNNNNNKRFILHDVTNGFVIFNL